MEYLQRLDQKLTLSKMSSESRNGGIKIGKRYLNIVNTLYPQSGLQQYAHWIDQQLMFGNASIVHKLGLLHILRLKPIYQCLHIFM